MNKKYILNICVLVLIALVGFHIVSNYQYLSVSPNPPVMEEYNYLEKIVNYYEIFRSPDMKIPARMKMAQPTANSQVVFCPVYPVLSAVLLLFTGIKDPQLWVCMLHNLFLAVIIFSVFGIGKRLYSPLAGLLAAIVTSTAYFLLVSLTRFILADIPAVAFLTLSFYLLLRTEGFKRRWYSLLFGFTWAVVILTRASVFILAPAALFLILFYLFEKKFHDPEKIRLRNLLLALLGFVLPLLYLGFYWGAFISFMLSPSVLTAQASLGPQSKFSWESAFYYLRYGLYDYGTALWLIPFIAGLLFAIIRPRKENVLPLAWFLGGYFMLTFVAGVKEPRYFIPLLPAAALISTSWIEQVRGKKVRYAVSLLIVISSFLSYSASSWGRGPLAKDHRYFQLGPVKILITPYVRPPQNKTDNIDALIDLINKDAASRRILHPPGLYVNDNINRGNFDSRLRIPPEAAKGCINVLTLFLDFNINGNLTYKTKFTDLKYRLPWVVNIPSAYYYDAREDDTRNRFWLPVEFFLEADYIIVKTANFLRKGLLNPQEDAYINGANMLFNQPLLDFHANFELLSKIDISDDGSDFLIYKRIRPSTIAEALSLASEAVRIDPENKLKHYNTLQSFLIKRLKKNYNLSEQLFLHLDEPYNGNLNIYVWSNKELRRLLSNVADEIVEKRLLLNMNREIRIYCPPQEVRWERFKDGRLWGEVNLDSGGEYYLVAEDKSSPAGFDLDNRWVKSHCQRIIGDGKFTCLLKSPMGRGRHSIKVPVKVNKNLLKEGSFEEAALKAWKIMSSDRGLPGRIDVDWSLASDGSDGMSCLNLVARKQVIGAYQEIDISKMDKDNCYILTLDYRHISGLAPEMIVWEYPYEYPVNPLVTLDNTDGQWQNYLTFIRPKGKTKKLIIYLYSRSDGKAVSENLFDNVRLYMAPSGSVVERLWVIKK